MKKTGLSEHLCRGKGGKPAEGEVIVAGSEYQAADPGKRSGRCLRGSRRRKKRRYMNMVKMNLNELNTELSEEEGFCG
jgi:hypothetical protein